MGIIIADWIIKGGSGKSSLSRELAVKLGQQGYKVLDVDLDQQADLTKSFGYNATLGELTYTSYDILLNPERDPREYAVIQTPFGVDLIPATRELRGAETSLAGEIGREMKLRQALEHLKSDYDFIFLDPPPGVGVIIANVLVAADTIIVPLEVIGEAWDKLPEMEELLTKVQGLNPAIRIGGIVCNKTDFTNLSRGIESKAREQYKDVVFKTTIPKNVRLAEAFVAKMPVSSYAPNSMGDIAYSHLAEEVGERYAKKQD